eukprot:15470226-Alexandrium_andersonii.AAC.1
MARVNPRKTGPLRFGREWIAPWCQVYPCGAGLDLLWLAWADDPDAHGVEDCLLAESGVELF